MQARLPKVIQKKLLKKQADRQFWTVFLMQAAAFLVVASLSLSAAYLAVKRQTVSREFSLQDFMVVFVIASAVLAAGAYAKKTKAYKPTIYKGFFMLACFAGGLGLLTVFLPVFAALVVIGLLLFLWVRRATLLIHNILLAVALAGAALLGMQFSTPSVLVLLVVISLYDFVAVYVTRHMTVLAKEMVEKKVIAGLIFPKEVSGLQQGLAKVKPDTAVILGGGDIVFPLLLAVSLMPQGIAPALVVSLFSLGGIFLNYYLFEKQEIRAGIPTLPAVAFCAIIGYMITLFIPA